ncbi:hypothetical protein, partial [Nostoc sp. CHAB 5715]|uniref:hypothetical protein n=1 Tax=Nostoc sp. CHAB 5715 TaxID=2780400 RepID=UPI001E5C4431
MVASKCRNYEETTYVYDNLGRRSGVKDPTGTITHTTFDTLGRPAESWTGTADGGGDFAVL